MGLSPTFLPPPLPPHCSGPRTASFPRLLGGASPCARPSRAQQRPFVTQRLPGPWPPVLGIWVDWVLSWQLHRCHTPARVARRAGSSRGSLLLLGSLRDVAAAVRGSGLWGPKVRVLLTPARSEGHSDILVNMHETDPLARLRPSISVAVGCGCRQVAFSHPHACETQWGEQCVSADIGGVDGGSIRAGASGSCYLGAGG